MIYARAGTANTIPMNPPIAQVAMDKKLRLLSWSSSVMLSPSLSHSVGCAIGAFQPQSKPVPFLTLLGSADRNGPDRHSASGLADCRLRLQEQLPDRLCRP